MQDVASPAASPAPVVYGHRRGASLDDESGTIPSAVLKHAASSQAGRTFLEVFDPECGVPRQVSFCELKEQMLAAAHWLRIACDLVRGDYCALLAHNSVAYLALSLGAMAVGATSINLNWRNARKVTEVLIGDLRPRVL